MRMSSGDASLLMSILASGMAMAFASEMDSLNSDELRIQGDFCLEKLGHRAVSLTVARELGKRRFANGWHLRSQGQRRTADAKPLTFRFQSHGRRRVELRRGYASSLKPKRQRHGEATSMGGGDKLLRICSSLAFKSCPEGIRRLFQDARISGNIPGARPAIPPPNGYRFANHENLLSKSTVHLPLAFLIFPAPDDHHRIIVLDSQMERLAAREGNAFQ